MSSILTTNPSAQVFVPDKLLSEGPCTASGWAVHPISCLIRQRMALQSAVAARLGLLRAAAKQVFGIAIRPATANDAWLVHGLAGWLVDQFIAQYLGQNELNYRRWREAAAVCAADDGGLPPLAVEGAASTGSDDGGLISGAQLAAATVSPVGDAVRLKVDG